MMSNWRIFSAALLLAIGGGFLHTRPAVAADTPFTLRVGVYDNKPKVWTDEGGVVQGIFPDVINAIAKKEGWQVKFIPGTFDEGMKRLQAREIDVMPDVAVSAERQQQYDFNQETVLVAWAVLYTREGIEVNNVTDLVGKRIAVMTDGIIYGGPNGLKTLLNSLAIKANIISVDVYADVFKKLEEGAADVGAVNHIFGLANEKDYAVKRTDIFFQPTELRFAMPKEGDGNGYLADRIDTDLRELKNDATSAYHQSLSKHLDGTVGRIEVLPQWFNYMAAVTLALMTLALFYVFILRTIRRRLTSLVTTKTADLAASEEKYRTIFESSNDAIVIIVNSRVADCNQAILKVFGYAQRDDVLGRSITDFFPAAQPDGRDSTIGIRDMTEAAVKNGKKFFEWTYRRADDTCFPTEVLLTPMSFHGRAAMQATIRDITERKEEERRLRQLDAMKSKFISVVSHRLRTPLTSVRWTLEEALGGKTGSVPPELLPILKMALESNTEALHITGDLLDAMEIEEGKMRIEKEEAVFEDIVRTVCAKQTPYRQAKKIKHVHEFPPVAGVKFTFDIKRIRDAVDRLDNNAISYTKEGGTITTRVIRLPKAVRFEISDDGIGVPLAEQARVFDRFFRASNAAIMKTDASGLGLYITKNIIEAHGGRIGMVSEEGKGSTFWFELPTTGAA